MSTEYKITCPNCKERVEVPAECLGQIGECPYCDCAIKGIFSKITNAHPKKETHQQGFIFNDPKAPATEKQLKQLERQGIDISRPSSKMEASEIISKLTAAKPPSKAQVDLLKELGAEVSVTREEAKQLCEELQRVSKGTRIQRNHVY